MRQEKTDRTYVRSKLCGLRNRCCNTRFKEYWICVAEQRTREPESWHLFVYLPFEPTSRITVANNLSISFLTLHIPLHKILCVCVL